jgi:hypothetical protein
MEDTAANSRDAIRFWPVARCQTLAVCVDDLLPPDHAARAFAYGSGS